MVDEMFDGESGQKIGKQIVLPMRKAIEISFKSLKIRFWRSMITVSSIILAIAFLSQILIGSSIIRSLKGGSKRSVEARVAAMKAMKAAIGVDDSEELIALNRDLRNLDARIEVLKEELSEAAQTEVEEPEGDETGKTGSDALAALERRVIDLHAQIKAVEDKIGAEAGAELIASNNLLIEERNRHDVLKMALEGGGGESKEAVGSASDAPQGFFAGFEARDYWLVSIALIVCFVGIVNAMLMSVTERFREIGTMKCLGALDSFIVKLFVLESMFQGSLGTFMGIILGVVLSILRAWWLYGSDNFRFFPWSGMLACMALSQAVGTLLTIVAATFPARAAARMQPVDALRAEQ